MPTPRRIDDRLMRSEDDSALLSIDLLKELRLAREDQDEFISGRMRLPSFPVGLRLVETHQASRVALRAEVDQIFFVVVPKVEDGMRPLARVQVYGVFQEI